jgi:hypothetical protein
MPQSPAVQPTGANGRAAVPTVTPAQSSPEHPGRNTADGPGTSPDDARVRCRGPIDAEALALIWFMLFQQRDALVEAGLVVAFAARGPGWPRCRCSRLLASAHKASLRREPNGFNLIYGGDPPRTRSLIMG